MILIHERDSMVVENLAFKTTIPEFESYSTSYKLCDPDVHTHGSLVMSDSEQPHRL